MGTNRSEGGGGFTVHLRLIEIVKYDKPEPNGINLPTPQPPPLPTQFLSMSVKKPYLSMHILHTVLHTFP